MTESTTPAPRPRFEAAPTIEPGSDEWDVLDHEDRSAVPFGSEGLTRHLADYLNADPSRVTGYIRTNTLYPGKATA